MTGADGISTLPPGNDYGFISCAETSQAYGRDVHPGDPWLAMLDKLRMYCRTNAQRCKDCKGVDGFWSFQCHLEWPMCGGKLRCPDHGPCHSLPQVCEQSHLGRRLPSRPSCLPSQGARILRASQLYQDYQHGILLWCFFGGQPWCKMVNQVF